MTTIEIKRPRTPWLRHNLANRLRALRYARRWSQDDLAEATGLHRTYISLIEREQCSIGLDMLERLAEAFGVPVTELLSDPRTAPPALFIEEPRTTYMTIQ